MQEGDLHYCGGTLRATALISNVVDEADEFRLSVPGFKCDQCLREYLSADVHERLEALARHEVALRDSGFDYELIPSTAVTPGAFSVIGTATRLTTAGSDSYVVAS